MKPGLNTVASAWWISNLILQMHNKRFTENITLLCLTVFHTEQWRVTARENTAGDGTYFWGCFPKWWFFYSFFLFSLPKLEIGSLSPVSFNLFGSAIGFMLCLFCCHKDSPLLLGVSALGSYFLLLWKLQHGYLLNSVYAEVSPFLNLDHFACMP